VDFIEPQGALVGQLHQLACLPFKLRDFRDAWSRFGWVYEPGSGDEFGFQVHVPAYWPLTVDPLGTDVIGARLVFCFWDDYDPQFHDDLDEYARQRSEYEALYERAWVVSQGLLGPPASEWVNQDRDAHKAAVWPGQTGLLILQQAAFDLQFGIEIDFWLEPVSISEFRPRTPLIDWLAERSIRLHDRRGFPPLRAG
jgi:hypothetical protein